MLHCDPLQLLWDTHKITLSSWDEAKHAIQHHFIPPSQLTSLNLDQSSLELYDGIYDPRENVAHCIHILGAWYIHEEARCKMDCWESLKRQSCQYFLLSGKSPKNTLSLQHINKILFVDEVNPIHPPVVFLEHKYLLHHSLYPSPSRLPMVCFILYRNQKDIDDLEELRHLKF